MIKVQKLHPSAILPTYATKGSACFDLSANIDDNEKLSTSNGLPLIVPTGLAFEIPDGYVMLIFSRSGHGFKNDIRLANCVGVIDSDYRGEVKVKLTNDNQNKEPFYCMHGDRIAQAMILPIPYCTFEEVEELSTTARGTGGFGSTGVS